MVFFSQRKEGIYRATIIKMNEQYKIKISRDISVSGSVHSDRSRRESVYRYLLGRYNTPPPASIYQPHPSAIQTTHFPPTLWETRMFEIPVHLWDCGVIAPHGGSLCLYIKRMHSSGENLYKFNCRASADRVQPAPIYLRYTFSNQLPSECS